MNKNFFKKIIYKIIEFLEKAFPIGRVICFSSFPDFSDNAYALFKHMIENKYYEEYKLVWLLQVGKENDYEEIISRLPLNSFEVYHVKSFTGFYYYLRSKYTFFTHGLWNGCKPIGDKKIDLCHGMPLKKYGTYLGVEMKESSKGIATSDEFRVIMSSALDLSIENIMLTGQPRNDLLFEKSEYFVKNKIDKNKYSKVVMWMPTYRKSEYINHIQGEFQEDKIGFFLLEELEQIDKELETMQILLLIKLHPYDILSNKMYKKYKNIKIIRNQELSKSGIQLYPLIGACDALITDYSSVYIDYLILDRQIGFMIDDIESYNRDRGFIFENPLDVMPGELIKTKEEFILFLSNIKEEKDKFAKKRDEINNRFNKYKDAKSSERILKHLKINKKED